MTAFLSQNLHVIRFLYGLIFFSLGLAIFLQPRRDSDYYLANALSWLAAFALVHAVADWGLVFMPYIDPLFQNHALVIRSLGVIISYGLLLQFGLTLFFEHHPRKALLSLIPPIYTSAFILMLLLTELGGEGLRHSLLDVKILGRYFMGFPSAVLSAWGLLRQVPALKRNKCPHLDHLYGAVICFVLYALVGGLIVPSGHIFLAPILNEDSFLRVVGVPVEVARGLAVLGVTYFVVRLLDIFHLETQRRLQAAEQDRALLRERERIARELHDGIMQTLYGTGLGLKQVATLSASQPAQAGALLGELDKEIGRAIVGMRRFVLDLKEQSVSAEELAEEIQSQSMQIGEFAGLQVAVQTDLGDGAQSRIPGGVREEVLAVLRQGLSNVVRHAGAESVAVLFALEDDIALLRLSDTGTGFDPSEVENGRGLEALKERVEAMGGFIQVHSAPGKGTQLAAQLPLAPRHARSRAKELRA